MPRTKPKTEPKKARKDSPTRFADNNFDYVTIIQPEKKEPKKESK